MSSYPADSLTTMRRGAVLTACLTALAVPCLIWLESVQRLAGLTELAQLPGPYFIFDHAASLYLGFPLVTVSACVLILSPGLLLALAIDAADSIGAWLSNALLINIPAIWVVARLLDLASPEGSSGWPFVCGVLAVSLACAGLLAVRIRGGHAPRWPLATQESQFAAVLCLALPACFAAGLAPKFLWESFNGDGAHAFEGARLLLHQGLPLFSPDAGYVAIFPGLNSMLYAFPTAWFLRIFGELEVSARIPFLLYLAVLFSLIFDLAGRTRGGRVSPVEQILIWTSLTLYTLAMAFSATYSSYNADIALPSTQDTLLMVCVLGAIDAFEKQNRIRLAAFVAASCLSLPSGLILLLFFAVGVAAFFRPIPWRRLAALVACTVGWVAFASFLPMLLKAYGVPLASGEYESAGLLNRFRFLQVTDVVRFAYILVPCGVVPLLSFALWRTHDAMGRALIAVTILYFGMFYVQAFISLHHFVPAMLLPVVVYFRAEPIWTGNKRRVAIAASIIAAIPALFLSLPEDATPHLGPRIIGKTVDDRLGGYDRNDPAAIARIEALSLIVPLDWNADVPLSKYGTSPLTIDFHAQHGARDDINYVVQDADSPPPKDAQLLGNSGETAIYVFDDKVHQYHLTMKSRATGSALYRINKSMLFHNPDRDEDPRIFDVLQIARKLRDIALGGPKDAG